MGALRGVGRRCAFLGLGRAPVSSFAARLTQTISNPPKISNFLLVVTVSHHPEHPRMRSGFGDRTAVQELAVDPGLDPVPWPQIRWTCYW